MRVLLPLPLGPMRATIWPGSRESDTFANGRAIAVGKGNVAGFKNHG